MDRLGLRGFATASALWAREPQRYLSAAGGMVGGGGGAPMGVDDCGNDCEAEAHTGRLARSLGAAEALEGVRDKLRREAGAVVADPELECSVLLGGLEPYRACAVAERVLDEVGQRLLQPPPVAAHDHAASRDDLDRPAGLQCSPVVTGRDRLEQIGGREVGAADRQFAGVDAREQ